MNDLENKICIVQLSLTKLRSLGLNIPEIILWNKSPESEQERILNIAIVRAFSSRFGTTGKKVIMPGYSKGIEYLSSADLITNTYDYGGEALLILKAPKSLPLVKGLCQPESYRNLISISDNEAYPIIWGDN